MMRLTRGLYAFAAVSVCAALLVACSTDPLTSSLRPTAEDKAESTHAPAGAYGALLRLGEATRQAGDPASAVVFFRRAHAADAFKPEALVKLGAALSDLAQYNDAAQAFRDALDLDHNNTEALRGLGGALIALNQPEIAIENFKAANTIEPDYRNFNGLGVASDHLGRHKEAQEYYESGLKTFPDNLTLLNNLGLSQILSRDYDAAITTLVAAAQQPGATARQRQNLALAYGIAGRDADAERIARLDLDRQAVQSNLAYYGILRAANDEALLTAVLGVHAPAKPLLPAGGVPPAQAVPQLGPSSSDAPLMKPQANAAEPAAAPPNLAAVQPAAGKPQVKAKLVTAVTTGEREAQPSGGSPQTAGSPPAAAPQTAMADTAKQPNASVPPASADPADPGRTAAESQPAEIRVPAAQPSAEVVRSARVTSALAEDSRAANEQQPAAQEPGAAPRAVIAGRFGQTSVASPRPILRQTEVRQIFFPQTRPGGAPVWYAAAVAEEPVTENRKAEADSFFARIYDFFFKPAAAAPATAANAPANALATPTANPANTADPATITPAAGGGDMGPRVWPADVNASYHDRRATVPSPQAQPGGGPAAAP